MFLRSSFLTDNNSFDCIHPEKVTLSFPSDIATHCLIFPEYPELSATALYPFAYNRFYCNDQPVLNG